jgi:hypothetical protein
MDRFVNTAKQVAHVEGKPIDDISEIGTCIVIYPLSSL